METRDRRWTVSELLAWTTERFGTLGIGSPRVDAEHLLARALSCERIQLYVDHARLLDDEERAGFRELVRRRLTREPVAYIEGRRGFHALNLDLDVDPRVLIPRPETEHLVDWLLESLRPIPAPPTHVVDVGTGSGAIALAIKRARPDVTVVAVDISEEALCVASANAARLELEVRCERSDLLRDVDAPAAGWDAIVANLPYIPSADLATLAPEIRDFEPRDALDGGADGLDLVRRLIEEAARPGALRSGGLLALEIGLGQAQEVERLLGEAEFSDVQSRPDLAGIPRVIAARRA